jgi:hypothetical protein
MESLEITVTKTDDGYFEESDSFVRDRQFTRVPDWEIFRVIITDQELIHEAHETLVSLPISRYRQTREGPGPVQHGEHPYYSYSFQFVTDQVTTLTCSGNSKVGGP